MHTLGVDTGGTFTDFVYHDGKHIHIHKCLSTPDNPAKAIVQGIKALGLEKLAEQGALKIIHGTTVATNAALEGKGVKTAYITNTGFADILTIGRQNRSELYHLQPAHKSIPVPRDLCLEVDCRIDHHGNIISDITDEKVQATINKLKELDVEAVAINLLFSFVDCSMEETLNNAVPDTIFSSYSSNILSEYKEYERGIATWLNASLGPLVKNYLLTLIEQYPNCPISVMQSSAGTISAKEAGNHAVQLLLSGPAGGLQAAQYFSELCNEPLLLTFDMGGTSTDVSLLEKQIKLTTSGHIADYPVAVPMVDMHTIGAGGGSLAYIDAGGMLQVGPESAGSKPGPACYDQGGTQATVTDANLVLGKLGNTPLLGGYLPLDIEKARKAIHPLAQALDLGIEETALGISRIAEDHMAAALRVISIKQGVDPKDTTLICFGGAGGAHVCGVADILGIQKIIMPIHGGVLSALGMLSAPEKRVYSQTIHLSGAQITPENLTNTKNLLSNRMNAEYTQEGLSTDKLHLSFSADMRYKGQTHTLNISLVDDIEHLKNNFDKAHKKILGHSMTLNIEIVTLRLEVSSTSHALELPESHVSNSATKDYTTIYDGSCIDAKQYKRENIHREQSIIGPAIITEAISTTYLARSWTCSSDSYGNLILKKHQP